MKNIIQYLVSEKGFEMVEGRSDLAFSYSMVTQVIIKKDDITVMVGLAGKLHLSLMIRKNGMMAFCQDCMQISNEAIGEVVDRIKKEDYSYIEKHVKKVHLHNNGKYSETHWQANEYDFFMLKDLGL